MRRPHKSVFITSQTHIDEHCCRNVLLEQSFLCVDATTFKKFQSLLNQPLPPTDKLRRLLQKKAPWDK